MCSKVSLSGIRSSDRTSNNLPQEAFPDPSKNGQEIWNAAPLWPGLDPTQNIGYDTMAGAIKTAFDALNFKVSKKTHAFRVYAARLCDDAGLDDAARISLL